MSVPKPLSLGLALALSLAILSPAAPAVFELEVAGGLAYGVPHDVATDGGYAYVAAQGALSVFDISNPANPIQVAVVDTPGSAEGVAISGSYLYIADWSAGLRIVDISDPEAPVEVASVDTPGYAYDVAVSGNYAYVADHAAGLCVIDVSTPAAPSKQGTYDTAGYAWAVDVSGSYAYVADGFSGLAVVDISNPAAPAEVASCSTSDRVLDVAVVGNYAYLADGQEGLRLVDITNPLAPGCSFAALDLPGNCRGIFVDGDYAYLAAGIAGLQAVDITDPSDPVAVDSHDTPGRAYAVAVASSAAFVADDSGGLRVIDVSAFPTPTLVGQAETDGNAEAIAAPDTVAYVADGSGGLLAFDVLDPTDPTLLWSCTGTMQAMDVDVQGDYAYVADWGSGLAVIDTTGPGCGFGAVATGGNPNGVNASGNRAYVAAGDAGIVCCDTGIPSAPAVLWTIDTPGSANDVALSGNYAYVADGSSGLQIVNTVTPTGPVASVGTSGYAWGAEYAGSYIYLASGDAGVEVIDITTPTSPAQVATLSLSGSAHSVSVYQEYAYVSVGGHGVAVVDISDPTDPVFVTSVGTPSVPGPSDLVVAGGYAYVADAESGLVVVDLLPPYTELANRESPAAGEKLAVAEQFDGSVLAYVAARSAGLQVVQVSDAEEATDPALINDVQGLGDVTDIAIADTYGYVTDLGGRLSVVGLTNPANPNLVGLAQTSGSPLGVAASTIGFAKYAVIADGDQGISVVSTLMPSSPFEKASFDTPGWCADIATATLGGDPFACVADGESGLRLINLSPIGTPDVTVFYEDFEDGVEGWTVGGTAEWYASTPRQGTYSVRLRNDGSIERTVSTVGYGKITVSYYLAASITSTSAAVEAHWYDGGGWSLLKRIERDDPEENGLLHPFSHELSSLAEENPDLAIRFRLVDSATGDFGYVDNIQIISGSAGDPSEAGFYNTPGQARGVAVFGDYACVADGSSGLRIIDISAPGSPLEVGAFDTSGYAESIATLTTVALVADGDGGVVLVDFRVPTAPVEVAYYETPGWASDITHLAGHAYLTDAGWGLTILQLWHSFQDILFNHWAFSEVEAIAAESVTKGYPDGLYHPEIPCTRDQMCVFIARAKGWIDPADPMDTAGDLFFDVPAGFWAGTAISACVANDTVKGYPGGFFRPSLVVERDDMTVFLARAEGWIGIDEQLYPASQDLFFDIPADYWCAKAIEVCTDPPGGHAVVVRGYRDGFYRPNIPVTRDQMAVFLYRTFSDEW
jgi:hypothetical protein